MRLRGKNFKLWLGSGIVLTGLLLLAAPPASAQTIDSSVPVVSNVKKIPMPEPATLTLLALGGGALALARKRGKSGRPK